MRRERGICLRRHEALRKVGGQGAVPCRTAECVLCCMLGTISMKALQVQPFFCSVRRIIFKTSNYGSVLLIAQLDARVYFQVPFFVFCFLFFSRFSYTCLYLNLIFHFLPLVMVFSPLHFSGISFPAPQSLLFSSSV